jgi:hypothetical protein
MSSRFHSEGFQKNRLTADKAEPGEEPEVGAAFFTKTAKNRQTGED